MTRELKILGPEDAAALSRFFTDVFTHEPWNDDWSDENQLCSYIEDLTGQPNSLTLGFFEAGGMVGLSMGRIKHWFRGTEYCIDEFCIARDRQGQGLGTAFLREMEQYLLSRGIVQIFLQTDRDVPACRFYLKNGFIEQPGIVSFAKRFG